MKSHNKINHAKLTNPMAFRTFTMLCHHLCMIPSDFRHFKGHIFSIVLKWFDYLTKEA